MVLKDHREELDRLRQENGELTRKCEELEESNKVVKKDKTKLQEKCKELEESSNSFKKEYTELKRKCDELEEANKGLKTEKTDLEGKYKQSEESNKSLQAQLVQKETDFGALLESRPNVKPTQAHAQTVEELRQAQNEVAKYKNHFQQSNPVQNNAIGLPVAGAERRMSPGVSGNNERKSGVSTQPTKQQSPGLFPNARAYLTKKLEEKREAKLPTIELKNVSIPRALYNSTTRAEQKELLDKLLRNVCHFDLRKIQTCDNGQFPVNRTVVVPCINASRVGSDLGATFQNANLNPAGPNRNVIVIFFTPKAPHVPENVVSTYDKMVDEFRVDDMVDVYYFQDEFYQCDTNAAAIKKLRKILK